MRLKLTGRRRGTYPLPAILTHSYLLRRLARSESGGVRRPEAAIPPRNPFKQVLPFVHLVACALTIAFTADDVGYEG